jgi:alanyl-tRNA synthetase
MRRAIRFGRFLGMQKPFLAEIAGAVVEQMQGSYPHLLEARQLLSKVVNNEEERFLETIDNGLVMLNQELSRLSQAGESAVSGDFIFKLYDTFGFPVDIVRDIAIDQGLRIDEGGFHAAMEVQRRQSKKSWKGGSLAEQGSGVRELLATVGKTGFVGYDRLDAESEIAGLVTADGAAARQAGAGEQVSVVCRVTPFYAESGGQVGDQGEIVGPAGRALVLDTVAAGDGLILHRAEIQAGTLAVGDKVRLQVAASLRRQTAANHTATHLLQAALKTVLGGHVKQSGSLVNPDRLRFDFTNFAPLSPEELVRVEDLVNREIRANKAVRTTVQNREEAVKGGATALFGEKYADEVRVVSVGDFSKELCGGSHVAATGEIGLLKIVGESGIAAGVRRLEAVTGAGALARFRETEGQLKEIAEQLKTNPDEIRTRIAKLQARQKELEKELAELATRQSMGGLEQIMAGAREIDGTKVVAARVQVDGPKTLRELGDRVRDRLGSGVAVLGAVLGDKVSLLAIVSKDLQGRYHAGNLVKELAAVVGGSGGGRPDMAQAGGSMPDKLDEALARVAQVVAGRVG